MGSLMATIVRRSLTLPLVIPSIFQADPRVLRAAQKIRSHVQLSCFKRRQVQGAKIGVWFNPGMILP